MRVLEILTSLTLEGIMQAPRLPAEDPSGGFKHGGWEQVRRAALAAPYDLPLGRETYELFAAHQPDGGNDNPET